MDWGTFAGATVGSFLIPGVVFWAFFRWARDSERYRRVRLTVGWALGMFLIYAATLPAGRGFLQGLTFGHAIAIGMGLFLTYRAMKQPPNQPT